MRGKMKYLSFIVVMIAIVVGGLLLLTSAPSERVIIQLPFDQDPSNINPMGETIEHPDHGGHPGIDFQWRTSVKILSSSDGVVSYVSVGQSKEDKWDVEVLTGNYFVRYKELESVHPQVEVGSPVVRGDVIGDVGDFSSIGFSDHYQLHWEFGIVSTFSGAGNRLCPMTYFDEESRVKLLALWEATDNDFKEDFPYICSGFYFGKDG
jgi:murein DD-endopeptidase MepM/ murein hydrolase activator NlpD